MKILGIDPALASIGYAILDNGKPIDYGVITTSKSLSLGVRLIEIKADITHLVKHHQPDKIAIEQPFFRGYNTNAGVVQYALGVILLAIAEAGYYNPEMLKVSTIKQAIAGKGNADKLQVRSAIQRILNISEKAPKGKDDQWDALAVSYTLYLQTLEAVA